MLRQAQHARTFFRYFKPSPLVLSLSKDTKRVFQQPARRRTTRIRRCPLVRAGKDSRTRSTCASAQKLPVGKVRTLTARRGRTCGYPPDGDTAPEALLESSAYRSPARYRCHAARGATP